jgi:hypothetical protein
MQNGTDIYPPFSLSARYIFIYVIFIFLIIGLLFLLKKLLLTIAIRTQQRALHPIKNTALLEQALQQLSYIYQQYNSHAISPQVATTQASLLVRQTFDELMNHQTRFEARYEVALRRLEKLEALLAAGYPVEFVENAQFASPEHEQTFFTLAKEVLELCR